MRKVVEVVFPALHQAVIDEAHIGGVKVNLLASVLLAYALEHKEDALAHADRLIDEWENRRIEREPILRVIRSVRPTHQP